MTLLSLHFTTNELDWRPCFSWSCLYFIIRNCHSSLGYFGLWAINNGTNQSYIIFFIRHWSVLTPNSNYVFLTGVGDPFLEHNIRYHCPKFCLLKFDNNVRSTFSRHIWLYDRCHFNSFCDEIQQTDWHVLKHDNIDTYAESVTTCITELAIKKTRSKPNHNL